MAELGQRSLGISAATLLRDYAARHAQVAGALLQKRMIVLIKLVFKLHCLKLDESGITLSAMQNKACVLKYSCKFVCSIFTNP